MKSITTMTTMNDANDDGDEDDGYFINHPASALTWYAYYSYQLCYPNLDTFASIVDIMKVFA